MASTTAQDEGARRTRDPAATRARILAAAERLFAERGYDGVSMPAIAEASDITAGAIYRHFTSKAALFFEVVRRAVEETPRPASGAHAGIAGLPAAVASYSAKTSKRLRQMAVETHYAAARDADVRRFLRRSLDHDIAGLAQGFAAAQAAGEAQPGLDPKLLANAVMVFIMGQMHLETLAPQLVGDPAWQKFVSGRVAALLGLLEARSRKRL
ncbi:MAG: TetR/AcrR family transcriptional regulator [Caulobacteraceae bacterium]|nr:TetR/AcrR family transcriptional regulator [Caulobacteraceae bacterium]